MTLFAHARGERAFVARLEAKARAIAEAKLSARRDDPRRWRRAGWVWPLFAKER